jgi:hypothetical protein
VHPCWSRPFFVDPPFRLDSSPPRPRHIEERARTPTHDTIEKIAACLLRPRSATVSSAHKNNTRCTVPASAMTSAPGRRWPTLRPKLWRGPREVGRRTLSTSANPLGAGDRVRARP